MTMDRSRRILEFSNVSFSYGTHANIDGLSFYITRREVVSIIARSGFGKSTILRLAAGLLSPQKGEILFESKPIFCAHPSRAILFQEDALLPWISVIANVHCGVLDIDRAEWALHTVGLWNYRNHWPRELSGGMKKKVELARTLASNARLLLLDEPFSSLDYFSQRELYTLLEKILSTEEITALLVTHNIDEANLLSDRIAACSQTPVSSITTTWIRGSRGHSQSVLPREFSLLFKECN